MPAKTRPKTLSARDTGLVSRAIAGFDAESEANCYTDTQAVWDLLTAIRNVCNGVDLRGSRTILASFAAEGQYDGEET